MYYKNILINFTRALCLKASYLQLISDLIVISLLPHPSAKIDKFKARSNVFEIQSESNFSVLKPTVKRG